MEQYDALLNKQKTFFNEGTTQSIHFREKQLKQLYKAVKEYENEILSALYTDLHKSEFEAYSNEIGLVYTEIRYALKNIKKWSKRKRIRPELFLRPGKTWIQPEPYGTVLIIAPWNYPFQLLFGPLVGAIAAGNTAVLKPSEFASATAHVMERLIKSSFSSQYISIVQGEAEAATALLHLDFDYVFFTGSVPIGKKVMEACSKKLIPHTLELGGKSPAFVDENADVKKAAREIVFGKFNNAGQTCIAPDYVLVHTNLHRAFIDEMQKTIQQFYGENPENNSDYGRIVNTKHFKRLEKMLDKDAIVYGGTKNKEALYIEPTILGNIDWEHESMQEEIFGPILPVLTYSNLDEAINIVRNKPKPLALYVFTKNKNTEQKILETVPAGGGGINNTLMHVASVKLPFGGAGSSGIGRYHGKATFETFSNMKSILKKPAFPDMNLAYPGKRIGIKLLRWILR